MAGVLEHFGTKLIETVTEWTGREVSDSGTNDLVESLQSDNRMLQKTLDFVGFKLFNFEGGSPWELKPQARKQTAQKALTAFVEDPMAGQQVNLYISFVFGRGVPQPRALDPEVQKVLDETWDDEANKRILTSFEKLVEKGIDFNVQSNVFFLLFDDGEDGKVRLSLKRFDDVVDGVRHPEDNYRITYYKAVERRTRYDWTRGTEEQVNLSGPGGGDRIIYHEALGGFDEENAVMVEQDRRGGADVHPPDGMIRPGKVLHLATNKTSEMIFGVPTMRRLLRWYTAHNETLESHVNRMKAMASIYMKATAKGANQGELDRLASMATGRRPAFGVSNEAGVAGPPRGPGVQWENDALNFEPFKIDSGAADVSQSIPQLRGQFAGGGGFPQPAYFGAESGQLAGAQAVELPVLKYIEREQEVWSSPFKALGTRAIQRAIEVGDLTERRPMTEDEQAAHQAELDAGQTPTLDADEDGTVPRDLKFEVPFPSPLKRVMADLVGAAVQTATAVDPNGSNPELSRWLFGFILAEAFDIADPQRIVDLVLPRQAAYQEANDELEVDPESGEALLPEEQLEPGATGPDGKQHPSSTPYGGRRQSDPIEDKQVTETPAGDDDRTGPASARRRKRASVDFEQDVMGHARKQLAALSGSTNGNGPG